jgi:hypothetical protein
LQYIELHKLLSEITYKPDVRFLLHRHVYDDTVVLTIKQHVPDADNPDKIDAVQLNLTIDLLTATEESIMVLLYDALVQMETHEVQEFLRLRGKHHKDPHPEQKFKIALPKQAERHPYKRVYDTLPIFSEIREKAINETVNIKVD